ncbi:unnamed protein product [Auanema sp. JU1783]|nr:unnamed protein product [Auanema sp. JU1783]
MTSVETPVSRDFQSLSLSSSFRFSRLDAQCSLCLDTFDDHELRVLVDGQNFHKRCFRCAQCFKDLEEDSFYNFENRFYCKHDFYTLYAPICRRCNGIVEGKVKYTLNAAFHPHCFTCMVCEKNIIDSVYYVDGLMVCTICKSDSSQFACYRCNQCKQAIDFEDLLRKGHDFYHAYHFKCHSCKLELTKDARTLKNELYCLRCYDLRSLICSDCKQPIDQETERSVLALDKHYHVDHFRCYHCGRPFMGTEFFERNKKAYCKNDFLKLFADACFICCSPITGTAVRNFGKCWCVECYHCMTCWKLLKHSDKVACIDDQPMCKKCMKTKNYQQVSLISLHF